VVENTAKAAGYKLSDKEDLKWDVK